MAFMNNDVLIYDEISKNFYIYNQSGNRNELSYSNVDIDKFFVSGKTVFFSTYNNRYYWFNTNTSIAHEFMDYIDNDLDNALGFGIANSIFYIVYNYEKAVIKCDFSSNTFTEVV